MWTYNNMYKWYTKKGKVRDPLHEIVYAIVYDAKKPKQKDVGKLEPFIKRNITYVGESPLLNENLFPNNLYLVYDDNKSEKQWLYFVSPRIKEGITLPDHFTFCYDKSDVKNPCHFHSTTYDINTIENDTSFRHVKDYFPDKLETYDNIIKNPLHRSKRDFIIQLMDYPRKVSGGTKKRNKQSEAARNITNQRFCHMWFDNKIKSMTAFGICQNDKIYFTVKVTTNERLINNRIFTPYSFVCNVGDDYEGKLQDHMSNLSLFL